MQHYTAQPVWCDCTALFCILLVFMYASALSLPYALYKYIMQPLGIPLRQ